MYPGHVVPVCLEGAGGIIQTNSFRYLQTPNSSIQPKEGVCKLKDQNKTEETLTRHLLRSLNNDRRNSLSRVTRVTIGQTVRRDPCLREQSCLDQFDDSFALEMDSAQPLTPRKSPHLLRRGSFTRLSKINRPPAIVASKISTGGLSSIITGGFASSRKKFVGVRKRVLRLIPRRSTSPGYSKL
uniref:Uncharacterized protein n=1 Tax=Anopheles maculatus TaxID=74869 RepID=A0A182SMD1_9DIPT